MNLSRKHLITGKSLQAREFSHHDLLDYAWRYFALHAEQRMSLFNFFLVLSSLVGAGLGASLLRRGRLELLGAVLGLLLAVVSLAFWKLDERVSFLIKHSEKAMIEIEQAFPMETARLFSNEVALTLELGSHRYHPTRVWTYGATFRFVFAVMGMVGVGGALVSLYLHFR